MYRLISSMSRLQVLRICSVCGRHFCLSEMGLAVFVELLSCDDSDLGPISWACKCSKLEVQYVFDQLRSQDIGINQGVPVLMVRKGRNPIFQRSRWRTWHFCYSTVRFPNWFESSYRFIQWETIRLFTKWDAVSLSNLVHQLLSSNHDSIHSNIFFTSHVL